VNPEKPIKVVLIERSLGCFRCALLGLIPVLGLPFMVSALRQHWQLKRKCAGMWNPAQAYLKWGGILAWASAALFAIVAGLAIVTATLAGMD
jgi:hypothetical protein